MEPYQFEPKRESSSEIKKNLGNDEESESREDKRSTDSNRTSSANWYPCGRCNIVENKRMCICCKELASLKSRARFLKTSISANPGLNRLTQD